jgi:hypothetical protein
MENENGDWKMRMEIGNGKWEWKMQMENENGDWKMRMRHRPLDYIVADGPTILVTSIVLRIIV